MNKAVIYCRVSSQRQATEGHGLSSQESSCRKYANEQNLEVLKVFTDDYSGGGDFWKRPGIRALLEFLDQQNKNPIAVIFDDLKRFARDTMFHLKLREEFSSRNATPRCPNFRFDESPEGLFVETVIAATAELERKQNRRQVISRMKARLEAGHWVFSAPLGYGYETDGGKKAVVFDPSLSDHTRYALESFASGKLTTLRAVRDYQSAILRSAEPKRRNGISKQAIRGILENEFYSGWCVCKKWGIRVRGNHDPLISEQTHQRILHRLESVQTRTGSTGLAREDFPLRGHIICLQCRRRFTAGWSHGRSSKYPYYQCQTVGCAGSIPKNTMEQQFAEKLKQATPWSFLVSILEKALGGFLDDQRLLDQKREGTQLQRLKEVDRETARLLDSVARANSSAARQVYEERIEILSAERERLKTAPIEDTENLTLEPVFDEGLEILRDPFNYWLNGDLGSRRIAQKIVFETPIPYDRNSGYRTAEFTLFYQLFRQSEGDGASLVELTGQNLNPVAEELQRWKKIFKTCKPPDVRKRDGPNSA